MLGRLMPGQQEGEGEDEDEDEGRVSSVGDPR